MYRTSKLLYTVVDLYYASSRLKEGRITGWAGLLLQPNKGLGQGLATPVQGQPIGWGFIVKAPPFGNSPTATH
jgi:hypothetical protein